MNHRDVAEEIAREVLNHLSIIEPETDAKDGWLYQVRLGDLRMIGMPEGKALPAIAAILEAKYGQVVEERKIIQVSVCGVEETQSTQCQYIVVALTNDGKVFERGNSWGKWQEIPNDTVTITERKEG